MLNLRFNLKYLLAHFVHFLFFLAICSFEVSFFSPTRSLIEVDLWFIPLVFIFLHKNIITNLIFLALAAMALSSFTGTPHYQLILALFVSMTFIFFFKNGSYTKGNSYFSICTLACILIFHISLFLIHLAFEETIFSAPSISWIISSLATPAFIFLIKPILVFIDKTFQVSYPFGFEV